MKLRIKTIPLLILTLIANPNFSYAEDFTMLGGDLTTFSPGRFAIQLPAPNVVDEDRRQLMLSGFTDFHTTFTPAQGAGPFLVNNSCGGCHVQNGRGPVRFSRTAMNFSAIVVKVNLKKKGPDGNPLPVPGMAGVLQNHSFSGKRRFNLRLAWIPVQGRYQDGTEYELRKPNLSFTVPGIPDRKILRSLRMSPPIIGPGLLESIPEETLVSLSDPLDGNGDGISGRPNYVAEARSGEIRIGRFGYKAVNPTVEQQSLGALFNEMGMSSDLFPDGSGSAPEFGSDALMRILFYQNLAGVPAARDQSNPLVQRGAARFSEIGCADCHTPTISTGASADPELAFQTIHPFTDLLLHDMGPALSDGRPEGTASGSEWRTSPLWGLGFSKTIAPEVAQRFLHDGRARTIEEAILWHGGEAQASRSKFKALDSLARSELLEFLNSL